ncbi:hypothetical protein EXIGLDRAFT_772915, partial [Exidia glandulosa HHB12029]
MSPSVHDPSVPNSADSTLSPPAAVSHNQAQSAAEDALFSTDEPPPYTPRPDLRTGEATVEY